MKDPLEQRAQLYTDRAGELRPAGSPLRGADDFLADMCFAPNHPVDAALPLRRIIRLPPLHTCPQKLSCEQANP